MTKVGCSKVNEKRRPFSAFRGCSLYISIERRKSVGVKLFVANIYLSKNARLLHFCGRNCLRRCFSINGFGLCSASITPLKAINTTSRIN